MGAEVVVETGVRVGERVLCAVGERVLSLVGGSVTHGSSHKAPDDSRHVSHGHAQEILEGMPQHYKTPDDGMLAADSNLLPSDPSLCLQLHNPIHKWHRVLPAE